MKEFHIKHDEKAIRLETDYTKFDSLEQIMLLLGIHFIEKGKTDRLKVLLGVESGKCGFTTVRKFQSIKKSISSLKESAFLWILVQVKPSVSERAYSLFVKSLC